MSTTRLYYIDNLRIFLISLVVLLHLNITYGAPGGWMYEESQADIPEVIIQVMFNMTNQAYFMGMFFFISAFFTAASLKRKTTGKFVKDRLIRLGIPLLVFYFILHSVANFIHYYYIKHEDVTLAAWLINPRTWGFGPMWFVETLLIFTFLYLLLRKLKWKISMSLPGTGKLIMAACLMGLSQYVIRIWLPVGWSLPHTGLQFPFFVQYIVMLVFGVVAYDNNWLDAITFKSAKRWFIFAQIMIWIVLPLLLFSGGENVDVFVGRGTWQSLGWAIWEQLVCVAMIIGLFGMAKRYFNSQGVIARQLSESAYGVYIIHPVILLTISAIFLNWQNVNQLVKFIVLAPVTLISCFLLAWVIKQIPGVRKVI